jgi:TonB-linked SusC/RagA family outer membrane protein
MKSSTHALCFKRQKLFRIMKLSTLLIFCVIMQISASTYSQNVRLQISMTDAKITEVFAEIKKKSEFDFLDKSELVKDLPNVTIDFRNITIVQILDDIIPNQLEYEISDKTVIIRKNPNSLPKGSEINADVDISGIITDENGQGLPGASIVIQGTTTGGTSDLDGNYKLTVPDDAILEISFVGYKTQNIEINGRSEVNVSMEVDLEVLGEVVVIGYGTVEKKDITGAISSVQGSDFIDQPVSGLDMALQGRLAGVQVVRNGGSPGASTSIRIRGTGTVNNSEPLYIVDGVPTSNIDGINPNNIESVEVLKDASASAIYGTRAANGVVIVTTKKGESGKLNMNINSYTGITTIGRTLDVLDASTLAEIKRERYTNDGIPVNPIWEDSQYQTQRTNWQDELFTTGKTQNIDLTISGGSEKSTFMVALGYYNEEGIVKKAEADRFSLQINSDHKVTEWLKIGQNMSLSTRTSNGFNTNSAQTGLVWSAIRFHPGLPVQDSDGNFSSNQISGEFGDINNPIYDVDINDVNDRTTRLLSNVTSEISITKELKLKANFGIDGEINDFRSFNPIITNQIRQAPNNSANRRYSQSHSFLMEYFLTYDKSFGDSKVSFVGGYTEQSFNDQGFSATAISLPDEDPSQRFLSTGVPNVTEEFRNEDGLRSVFGRVNYSLKDKYLLTATIRSDESSRFLEGNRRGVFPAFSLGWRLSDEDFFDVPFISEMKVTGGWGELGNQNIPRLQYLARISRGQRYSFGADGSAQVIGANQSSFANENITWETVRMSNFGISMGFLDNRLTSNFNYFIKNTDDMLLSPPVIGSQGSNPSPFLNVGQVRNQGLEIELNWQGSKGDFSYNIGANAAFIDNEVVQLVDGTFLASRLYGRPAQELSRTIVGNPIGTFYGWRANGLFQTQAEIDAHAEQTGAVPGDVRFVDLNNDNVIDDEDRTILGSPNPQMTYGINANMSYKGFDLTMFFLGVAGVEIFNADRMQGLDASYPFNLYSEVSERWTGPGTSNEIPRVSTLRTNLNHRSSDMFIESGDFLRLKNLTIGYTLPTSATDKIGLSRLRFYLTGQNVFTITGYSGLDPELGLTEGNLQQNVDFAQFPQARTFLVGVNIGF